MTDVEIWALQVFSAVGSDMRVFYKTIDSTKHIEYIGVTPAVNAATSAKVWFIGKLYYDVDGCMTRFIKLSTQQVLDDRVALFP